MSAESAIVVGLILAIALVLALAVRIHLRTARIIELERER